MGVYIKGMEMPKDEYGYTEIQIWGDGRVYTRKGVKLIGDYSAIEVPDHGDLIEANSLKIRMGQRFCLDARRIMEIVRETVDTAKVVIPAERRAE